MTEEFRKPTPEEMADIAARSREFVDTIFATGDRLDLAPEVIMSLFGFLARQLAKAMVEEKGITRAEATHAVISCFMAGVGAVTLKERDLPDELRDQVRDEIREKLGGRGPVH